MSDNSAANEPPPIHQLSASELNASIESGTPFELVDVRTDEERAFATAVMFLELNGYRFQAGEAEAVIRTLALAAGELKEHEYAEWLKANSKRT